MNRALIISICTAAAALGGACNRHDNGQQDRKNIVDLATHPAPAGSVAALTVNGCLTASGDRFVLTQMDDTSSTNHTYQLVNADDQLRNLVGKRVQVIGDSQPSQKAETREVTPPAAAATSGTNNTATATSGAGNGEAKVSTVEDTKIDANTLRVTSVMDMGGSCSR